MRPVKLAHLDLERIRGALPAGGPDPTCRAAAVAAVLRERAGGEPEILLIKRATREGDPWSGHMAFPGGRQEATDRDLLHTAMRETLEEVGLDLEAHGELLGALPDVPAIRQGQLMGMSIRAYVFALGESAPDAGTSDEVEAIVWAPLLPLYRGDASTTIDYDYNGTSLVLPAHDVGGHIVWGLTHRMLTLLFQHVDEAHGGGEPGRSRP